MKSRGFHLWEEMMVEFWVQAQVSGELSSRRTFFKKFKWVVLPRVGEWIELGESDGYANPVSTVWHWMHVDKIPTVLVEVSEYELNNLLEKEKDWVNRKS